MKLCAITGANGYVGSRLAAAFAADGWAVRKLVRSPRSTEARFALGERLAREALEGVTCLVHCAWDRSLVRWSDIERINVAGSLALFDAAEASGVARSIFISSIAAYDGCRSMYGRSKIAVEQSVTTLGGVNVRPGLVYGIDSGGMVAALSKAAAKLPIIPLIGSGSAPIHSIHEADLCRFVLRLAEAPVPRSAVTTATKDALSFRQLIAMLAAHAGKKPLLVPAPWQLPWVGLYALEWLGVRAPFLSDSVLSLVTQNPRPDFAAADALEINVRPFDPSALTSTARP